MGVYAGMGEGRGTGRVLPGRAGVQRLLGRRHHDDGGNPTLHRCHDRPAPPRAGGRPAGPGPPGAAAGHRHLLQPPRAHITERAALRGPTPAVIYVHGGGWVGGPRLGGFLISTIGPALAANGFVVVSIDYRLGQETTGPTRSTT